MPNDRLIAKLREVRTRMASAPNIIDDITTAYLTESIQVFIHEGTEGDQLACLIWWIDDTNLVHSLLDSKDKAEMERQVRSRASGLSAHDLGSKIDRLWDHVSDLVRDGTIKSNAEFFPD
jgi:hypothetical protein